jgi:hypothetical protein
MINTFSPQYTLTIGGVDRTARVIQMGAIHSEGSIDSITMSSDVSITLDDSDGEMKAIFDSSPLYGLPVIITFKANPTDDALTVFKGKVSTPIVWIEMNRTMQLACVSSVETSLVTVLTDEEIEDEICPPPNPPIGFGTVLGVPAINRYCIPDCKLLEAVYEAASVGKFKRGSANLTFIKTKFKVSNPEAMPDGEYMVNVGDVLIYGSMNKITGEFETKDDSPLYFNVNYYTGGRDITTRPNPDDDADAANPSALWVNNFSGRLAGKYLRIRFRQNYYYIKYQPTSLPEPEGREMADPSFNDDQETDYRDVYVRCSQHIGDKLILENPVLDDLGNPILIDTNVGAGYTMDASIVDARGQYELGGVELEGGWPGEIQYNYPNVWYIPAGTQVFLVNEDGYDYVFNGEATEEVLAAYAFYRGELRVVPTTMYELDLSGPSILTVGQAMRGRNDWDTKQWYVSYRSSIAPTGNVVDVLEYVIDNYTTDLTADPVSFAHVRDLDSVKNYPCGFALFEMMDALELLRQVCWEAHIGIVIVDGVVYIRDLAEDITTIADPAGTVDEDTTEYPTIEMELTDVRSIYTDIKAAYFTDYFPERTERYVYQKNRPVGFKQYLYKHDYLIYNLRICVLRSVQFWLVRYSNSWHQLRVGQFYTKVDVKPFDVVEIDLPDFTVATHGVVLSNETNFAEDASDVVIWLPTSPTGGDPFPDFNDPYPDNIVAAIDSTFLPEPFYFDSFFLPGLKKRARIYDLTSVGRYGDQLMNQVKESDIITVKVKSVHGTYAVGDAVQIGNTTVKMAKQKGVAQTNTDYEDIKFAIKDNSVAVGDTVVIAYAPHGGAFISEEVP